MKKWIKMKFEWLNTRWNWYVLGYYHCDKCPYSWEERGYEDYDCGCYIKGDICDTCRLIPQFRAIIGWPKKRYAQYWEGHMYDGMGDWYEQSIKQEESFADCIKILLKGMELYERDSEGNLVPICKENLTEVFSFGYGQFYEAFRYYEDHAHPPKVVPLKKQWKDLIKLTWKQMVYDHIAPYLPRKRRKKNDY